jgi:hypothetical protein
MLACCFVRACKHLVSACACACHFSSGIAVIISCQYLYFCTSKSSKLGTCLADLFALLLPYCMQVGGFQYYQYVYFCTSKASQLRTCLPDVSSCFSLCLQVGGSEYYEQYSSIYSGAAPEMGSSRNRLSPPKDHHQPPPNGTQFTRFTGTKLQVLTQKALQL